MLLKQLSEGRNNNLNLLRLAAAMAVLVSHSFALVYGTGDAEPLQAELGITLGRLAVCVFFIMSGFLLTNSLRNRHDPLDFVWARLLRIMPGLVVVLLMTVLVLGPLFTTLPWSAYFAHPDVAQYLLKGITLLRGVGNTLPGVFHNNPYADAVNGSLWTLPYEVRMYFFLFVGWLTCRWLAPRNAKLYPTMLLLAVAAAGVLLLTRVGNMPVLWLLFFMFFSGAAYAAFSGHIQMKGWVFCLSLLLLVASTAYRPAFFVALLLCSGYIVFYLAYVPGGRLRQFNRLGDYSYGVYVYAFPVQQATMALLPQATVPQMFCISAALTLLFAVVSWHVVEKPAMRWRKTAVQHSRAVVSRVRNTWRDRPA